MARRGVHFLVLGMAGASWSLSCGDQRGRLDAPTGGAAGAAGSNGGTDVGTSGALGATATGGSPSDGGASGTTGNEAGGAQGGEAGAGGALVLPPLTPACIFHTEAPTSPVNPVLNGSAGSDANGGEAGSSNGGAAGTGGAGGEDGARQAGAGGEGGAGPRPTITVQRNGFAQAYLADSAGRALYVYGADLAGDCEQEPVSTCNADCKLSWPVFDAGARVVADTLDDALFGTIQRSDQLRQTTYRGWPLYYYKNDVAPGDVRGQGVGRIWHVAEVALPNVVVLRVNTTRYLADEYGHVLYTYEADSPGTADTPPQSACTGTCALNFPPFSLQFLAPVTYLDKSAFGVFVRGDGRVQQSYKGLPLYRSRADEHAGERNGASTPGWNEATP